MMPKMTDTTIQDAMGAYNRFLSGIWAARQEEMARLLVADAHELAEGDPRIERLDKVELAADSPPRLEFRPEGSDQGLVRVSLPGDGHWRLFLRFQARLSKHRGRFHDFELRVKRLRVVVSLRVGWAPGEPFRLLRSQVRATFDGLDLTGSDPALAADAEILEPILERGIQDWIREQVEKEVPKASAVEALEALGIAAHPPALPEPAAPVRLLEHARRLSHRIQQDHLPSGTLVTAVLAGPDPDDPVATAKDFADSATWSGHYLAAEAARFAATDDPGERDEAAAHALRVLEGFDTLLRLTEPEGLLSRVLVEVGSREEPFFHREVERLGHQDRVFRATVDGIEYLSLGHVTRDQYAGAFLGVGLAQRWIDRPEVRDLARRLALEMAGYLADRRFLPTEAEVDPALGGRPTSVTYLDAPAQVLAVLRLGLDLDPERFRPLWDRHRPLASLQWLFQGLQSLDPDRQYHRFNSEHSMALLLLLLTDAAEERRRLGEGVQLLRRSLARHQNAWFDAVELAAFPEDDDALSRPRAEIAGELTGLLTALLERSELMEAVELDGRVETVTYHDPASGEPRTIARNPVPVPERPGTDFLWQRSPFLLTNELELLPDQGLRPPGVDFLLPYWLGRLVGAVPGG